MQESSVGILDDVRSAEEKQSDILHSEVFGDPVPEYLTSEADAQKYVGMFPIDNQMQTSKCVAESTALSAAIFKALRTPQPFSPLSPDFIYRFRVNYPQAGMIPADANTISSTRGICGKSMITSPTNEVDENNLVITQDMILDAKNHIVSAWITIDQYTNIDSIAFAANTLNTPVRLLIYGTSEEWSQKVPTIQDAALDPSLAPIRHAVTVLPQSAFRGTDGKRYVVIQDSAGFGGIFYRNISEEWIKSRCYGAAYPAAFSPSVYYKPMHTFTQDLSYGMSNPDVTALQQVLQYLGFMPSYVNGIAFNATGYFGGMTLRAVKALQDANVQQVLAPANLKEATGYVGPLTRAFINKYFGSN